MKQVFYITVNEIILFHWQKQRIVHSYRFTQDDRGFSELSDYLARAPELPTSAVIDAIEEEFHIEPIPRVNGRDRKHLLDRKLRQRFRETGYTSSISLGRNELNAMQEDVLLSALNNSTVLDRFLGLIDKHKIPLKGVYSAAYIAESIYQKLHANQEYAFLINVLPNGYCRQSFFSKQKLKTSRLSVLDSSRGENFAKLITDEVQKKQRYLNRIHLLSENDHLDVNIICSEGEREELRSLLKDTDQWRFHFVIMPDLYDLLKLDNKPGTTAGNKPDNISITACFAHIVCKHTIKGNYISNRQRRYYVFRKLNQGLMAASIVLGLLAVVQGSINYMDALDYDSRSIIAARNTSYYQRKLQQVENLKPDIRYTARSLKGTIETLKKLDRIHFSPERAFSFVAGTLRQFPSITLDSLQWETVTADKRLNNKRAGGKNVLLKQGMRIIRLKGRIPGFRGNYVSAFEQVRRLVASIRQNPRVVQVKPVSMPVNTDEKRDISGYSGSMLGSKAAYFELMVVLKEDT